MNSRRIARAVAAVSLWLSVSGITLPARAGRVPGSPRTRATAPRWTSPTPIVPGELNEYPDVATDAHGTAWVTWVSLLSGEEHVFVRPYHGDRAGPAKDVGLEGGFQFQPRIVASGDHVWVAWGFKPRRSHGHARWAIAVRRVAPVLGPVELISGPAEDALRPALGLDGSGRPWVAWESRAGSRFDIRARPLTTPGAPTGASVVSEGGEFNLRPAVVPAGPDAVHVLWDSYTPGVYRVQIRRVSLEGLDPLIVVSPEQAFNIGPAAAVDADGNVFVAYATNADEQGRQRVGKSLRVRVLHDGDVVELAGGQPPRIATAPGRLDAIEFPTVHLDPAGRLWVFARRGQGFIAFRYEGDTWYPPIDLSLRGWGGRGKTLRAAWSPQGFHLVARRIHMLAHQLFIPPDETPPPIAFATPATVALAPPTYTQDPQCPGFPPCRVQAETIDQAVLASVHLADTFLDTTQPRLNAVTLLDVNPDAMDSAIRLAQFAFDGARTRPFSFLIPFSLLDTTRHREPMAPPRILPDGVGPPRPKLPSSDYDYTEDLTNVALPKHRMTGFYFGDLHTHSWMSDGAGDPDEVYTRSRDRYRFDFIALTDHGNENGNLLLPSEWEYLQLMADVFYHPGKFVTFVAYEWTSNVYPEGAGHRNIYYPGDRGPLFDAVYGARDTMTLFELIKTRSAIAVPHHIGWTGTDWEHHDPEVQRLAEIVSVHGAFEKPGNRPILPRHEMAGMFIRDGLSRGLRFGLVGGSDGHGYPWHYGVSRKEDVWRTGLTGVVSPALTRLSLFNALHSRLTVATSGAPIAVWTTVNGAPMGSDLVLDRPPRFDIRVEGTAPIREMALIRDGEDIETFQGDGPTISLTLIDRPPPGPHYYYVRVVQEDNEMAWASPIWIETRGRILIGPPDP